MTVSEVLTRSPEDSTVRARQHEILRDFDLLDIPGDAELYAVTRVAAALVGTPMATVNLLDTERQCQPATHGFAGADSPRDVSMCHIASLIGGVVHVPDAALDPRFADLPWVDGRWAALRLYASAPLVVDGVTVGRLCVVDDRPRQLAPETLDRLADLADVVVALFQRRRAIRRSERARAELERAHDQLATTQAFDRALLEALPVGVVAGDADRRIILFNRVSRQWHGDDTAGALTPDELPSAYDLYEADGTTPLPVDRVPFLRIYDEARVTGAEIVIHPHGRPPRTVTCSGTEVRDADGGLLGAVVSMEDVTAQRQLEEQLRTAALHDGLTGLPNRTLLVDRLEHALVGSARGGRPVVVLYCDLDGFKAVNDEYGHATGDEVLTQAAARLVIAVRPGDTVARMGGDEFVVICSGLGNQAGADAIAERVTASMAEPLSSSAGEHQLGVSVGVVRSGPGATPETMLTAADEDMYRIKRARRGPSRRD